MIKRVLLFVFLLGFSLTASAASDSKATLYQINVIVFKNIQDSGFNSEIWPNSPPQPDFAKAINFIPVDGANSNDSYRLLPAEQSGLKTALQRLNNSGRYKVLTSLSWQQPLTNSQDAKLLHVFAGKAYAIDGAIVDTSDGKIPANWELNGTVKASKSSTYYIDFVANFLLTERVPVMNTDNGGTSTETRLISFPLNQSSRIRAGEIHYMDNPVYGVLVFVTSIK